MSDEEISKKADEYALARTGNTLKMYPKDLRLSSSMFNGYDVAEAFYQGASWVLSQAWGLDILSDWYKASINETENPIWTGEHLEELTKDFILIKK